MHEASKALILFPGALGDFVCFLPTLLALHRRHTQLTVIANPSSLDLIPWPRMSPLSLHRREVSDLYSAGAPILESTRHLLAGHGVAYSWSGNGDSNFLVRLAQASGGEVRSFPFRGMKSGEHAVEYFSRCVGLKPAPLGLDHLRRDDEWLGEFLVANDLRPGSYLAIHPGSGGETKNWTGFAELAKRWREDRGDPIVVLLGPSELDRGTPIVDGVVVVPSSLPRLVSVLAASRLYVGNDSGVSHLAGISEVSGLALFGNSDPAVWAPRSARLKAYNAPRSCEMCSPAVFCTHRLSVSEVMKELDGVGRGRGD